MNNGVNEENNTLAPMAGVKIAPVSESPVDASNKATAASSVGNAIKAANEPTITNNTPVQPVVQNTVPAEPQAQSVAKPTEPVITNQQVEQTPAIPIVQEEIKTPEAEVSTNIEKPKKKINILPILIVLVIALIGYIVYSSNAHKNQLASLSYNCTPITSSKEDKSLDLDSTLVKDLYSKVKTTIREDIAQPEFNDNMRLYLAYRQILDTDKYDSNCNMFDKNKMEPYTCEVSTNFKPKAFKEETLVQEIKKLYGENTSIPLANVRLGDHSCIGGYQYIQARGEFVEGYCSSSNATSFKVTKTLKEATSNRNTIILTEEVKYHENESMNLPDSLKSGLYYYTFRLDMNYNYVLVSKTYKTKY